MRFLLDLQERSTRLMAEFTGQRYETIDQDFARDRVFTVDEGRRYGLVGAIARGEDADGHGVAPEKSVAT